MRRAEGGAKIFGVFRVKNHDFTPKSFIFYRFVMVVRKNVLEYIIALVVVKNNKVRFEKCLNKFQIVQSSIVQINLSITSLRLIKYFIYIYDENKFTTI
jgi:hypothetical protein